MFQVLNVLNTDILHTTLPQIYVAGTSPYFLTAPLVSRSRPLTGWKTRQLIVLSSNDFPHSQWSTYDGLQLMNKQRRRNNRERRKRRRSQSHFTVSLCHPELPLTSFLLTMYLQSSWLWSLFPPPPPVSLSFTTSYSRAWKQSTISTIVNTHIAATRHGPIIWASEARPLK